MSGRHDVPNAAVVEAVRGQLHATVDRLMDRWPSILALAGAPDRVRPESTGRAKGEHRDPTSRQAFDPSSTWQRELQACVTILRRLDTEAKRLAPDA